jgi:hypothetical protein
VGSSISSNHSSGDPLASKNLAVQIYGLDTCIFCTQYCQHGVRVYFASRVYESFFSPTLFYQSSFFGFQMFSSSRGFLVLRWFFNKVPLPASYSARLPCLLLTLIPALRKQCSALFLLSQDNAHPLFLLSRNSA